jgi:hypothetical protein
MNAAVRGAIVSNAERAPSAVLGVCMPSGGQMAGDRRVYGGQVAGKWPTKGVCDFVCAGWYRTVRSCAGFDGSGSALQRAANSARRRVVRTALGGIGVEGSDTDFGLER